MKKYMLGFLAAAVILGGCSAGGSASRSKDTSSGPVVSAETLTDAEKELTMIQSCIDDYNQDHISEREDYFRITIAPLPIEIEALPEIDSLHDLTEVKENENATNTIYEGYYMVNDRYKVIFSIYHPTTNSFWANGDIQFQMDPAAVTQNDPRFTDTRTVLSSLLADANSILNILYGINVRSDTSDCLDDQYCRYIPDESGVDSIEGLKERAESVYTYDFLAANYYPSAFEGNMPVYKEVNGHLYVASSELTAPMTVTYDCSRIISVRDNGDTMDIDILSTMLDIPQPRIYRLTLVHAGNSYRFPSAV